MNALTPSSLPRSAAPLELARTPLLYLAHQLTPATDRERAGAAATERFKHDGTGYWLMHVTRPQTIGYALADSPAGLLAWVYEKLVDWSEGYPWTDDEGACRLSFCLLSDR